ncbi:GTP-binding protein [Pseudonocardia sp. MH-G8]|uniref:CobW family GTP-binding protein n=1 Tax=Pseudonocardia sp. MH-G8 TaxID=1854588 RepID=UPI000BA18128|nr:GTP-binding protein [Pseudonocardia sp. MH-G8]OZM80192.1 cobalamin biosynthesis protein [Pseudonocardia sp. MH-G8]
MRRRTPVLVLAGFLGSGKTTLLNHLLTHSLDLRIGVIVNDFGSIPVDAMLVGGSAAGVVPVGNGCLCCVADAAGVGPMLDQLTGPGSDIDVIVIEASGIAEPGALVRLVLGSGNPHTSFGGLIEVVDTAEFEAVRSRHPELDRHVRLADLVVLNKTDRVDADQMSRVRELCRSLNDRAPVLATRHGVVDTRMLFDIEVVAGRQLMLGQAGCDDDPHHRGHLHAAYDAVPFVTDRPIDPRRFVDFLESRPAAAYRLKGVVHFGVRGHRQRYLLHAVGQHLRFERTAWEPGQQRRTSLVVIGCGMDRETVAAGLRACERAEPADPDAMFAVHRHAVSTDDLDGHRSTEDEW